MRIRIILLILITMLSFGNKAIAQTTPKERIKPKTVLLINAHLTYPGLSEGKLN